MVENRCLKIVLIRHGKPIIDNLQKITGAQLAEWVQHYDYAPIDPACNPPLPLLTTVSSIRCIITSPLRRSVESAVRAGIVAQELEALSRQKGSVLLLGHGIMNLLIAQRLRTQGWKSLQVSGNGYWKFSEYALYDK